MDIPIAIHKDENSIYGVTVPDLPGCYSAGNSIHEAIKNAEIAIDQHCDVLAELGQAIHLKASDVRDLAADAQYAGAIWATANVDLARFALR